MFESTFDWTPYLNGLVPAVGVFIAAAVLNIVRTRREEERETNKAASQKVKDDAAAAADKLQRESLSHAQENAILEDRVRGLEEFIGGKDATMFAPSQPGFTERFDGLEHKVDGMVGVVSQMKTSLDTLVNNGNGGIH